MRICHHRLPGYLLHFIIIDDLYGESHCTGQKQLSCEPRTGLQIAKGFLYGTTIGGASSLNILSFSLFVGRHIVQIYILANATNAIYK